MRDRTREINAILVFFICTWIYTVAAWASKSFGLLDFPTIGSIEPQILAGFAAGDAFAMGLLLFAILGLYRMRAWGAVLIHASMGAWIYSSVVSVVGTGFQDAFVAVWAPVYILIPAAIMRYLWKIRGRFVD